MNGNQIMIWFATATQVESLRKGVRYKIYEFLNPEHRNILVLDDQMGVANSS